MTYIFAKQSQPEKGFSCRSYLDCKFLIDKKQKRTASRFRFLRRPRRPGLADARSLEIRGGDQSPVGEINLTHKLPKGGCAEPVGPRGVPIYRRECRGEEERENERTAAM